MVQLTLVTDPKCVFRNKEAQEVIISAGPHLAGACVRSRVLVQQACWKDCHNQHCEVIDSTQEDIVCCKGTFKIGLPPLTVAFCITSKFSKPKCHTAPSKSCSKCGHLGQCAQCIAKNKCFDEQGSLLAVDPCCLH